MSHVKYELGFISQKTAFLISLQSFGGLTVPSAACILVQPQLLLNILDIPDILRTQNKATCASFIPRSVCAMRAVPQSAVHMPMRL
jgi:hypothetical protein